MSDFHFTLAQDSSGAGSIPLSYVIVTPVRDEARYIDLTIKSMIAQTLRPLRWVIVSDGSTDGTDDIVRRYMARHSWIELLRMPERRERHFAGKAHAFNAGYQHLKALPFDVVGNVDGDVSFEADHFELLVARFTEDPRLGVAGSPFREGTYQYDYRFTSKDNVWGGCQFFRRECFDAIGGYTPLAGGGVDLVAVVTARMNGWHTRTYPERVCIHHRVMNSAMNKGLGRKFKWGQSDYRLGSHPAWELFRCIYQMSKRPYLVGGLLTLAGYYFALITQRPRSVSREFSKFRGREQMQHLMTFVMSFFHFSRRPTLG
jgi:glycosyltransferase involved in cell wall biosynthesis